MPSTIFIIDSSPAVRRMVEQTSTPAGYEVIGFQDGPSALEAAKKTTPALIIADYHLDNMTFSGFCKEVHKIDNLSETLIISLVGAGDKLDESLFRSLGVKAFLKKPFQAESLLDLIKDVAQAANGDKNGAKKKRRAWPPVSSSTDSDEEEGDNLDEDQTGEFEATVMIPPPATKDKAMASPQPSKSAAHQPEDAMKGLFKQLVQSMSEQTEKKLAELLPQMVSKKLADMVANAVESEIHQQLGANLTQERMSDTLEPLVAKELPKVLSREMATLEPIIRHSIFELASPLIKDQIDAAIREQTVALKDALPEMIREHLKSLAGQIQDEIRKAAAEQAEAMADTLVRSAAEEQVKQTVLQLVPGIAEEQVKSEIKRLSAAA